MEKKRFRIIIILGKSGSGKGTQVEKLATQFNLKIISSGTLLRNRIAEGGFAGERIAEIINKGWLVPTPIIFHMWLHELERAREDQGINGIIFEGSPRKLYEAFMLDEALWFYNLSNQIEVLHLAISDKEAMKRLLDRGRSDDQEEYIKERLRWYKEEVMPVIEHYKEKGLLIEINGEQSIEDVHKEILLNLEDNGAS